MADDKQTTWPLAILEGGRPLWHIAGTNPPRYEEDLHLEAIYMAAQQRLKAPFPYFGGKSRIANMVWERFGKIDNYVEPFFGSGAMLLSCPTPGHTETVNDADGLLANFWRALQYAPDEVASYADWPVNEADLHARHRWLVDHRSMVESLMQDPEWYDAQAAGWWVWGISQWIGTGWCPPIGAASLQTPHLGNAGRGPHRRGLTKDGDLWKVRPNLGNGVNNNGNGVHQTSLHKKRPAIGGRNGPSSVGGVNAAHLAEKVPHVGNAGRGGHRAQLGQNMPFVASPDPDRKQYGLGIHGISHAGDGALYDYFQALAARLRRTRVVCGDFERILGPSVTWRHGMTAVFLDPPYADGEHAIEYAGGGDVWERTCRWCEANGDNALLRIALCGYEGTWDAPAGWVAIKWRTPGGYGSQGNGRGRENASREVVWFCPHCLDMNALPMFAYMDRLDAA